MLSVISRSHGGQPALLSTLSCPPPADGGVGCEADILYGTSPHGSLSGCSTAGDGAVKNYRLPHNRKEI